MTAAPTKPIDDPRVDLTSIVARHVRETGGAVTERRLGDELLAATAERLGFSHAAASRAADQPERWVYELGFLAGVALADLDPRVVPRALAEMLTASRSTDGGSGGGGSDPPFWGALAAVARTVIAGPLSVPRR